MYAACLALCLSAGPLVSARAEAQSPPPQATPTAAVPPSPAPAADAYQMEMAIERPPTAANQAATLHLRITPRPGWELKTTTPMNLKLSAAPPLRLPRAAFAAADWSPARGAAPSREVVAEIGIDAPDGGHPVGQAKVSAQINFFLCSKSLCRRFVDQANVMVPVEASGAPPSPPLDP